MSNKFNKLSIKKSKVDVEEELEIFYIKTRNLMNGVAKKLKTHKQKLEFHSGMLEILHDLEGFS